MTSRINNAKLTQPSHYLKPSHSRMRSLGWTQRNAQEKWPVPELSTHCCSSSIAKIPKRDSQLKIPKRSQKEEYVSESARPHMEPKYDQVYKECLETNAKRMMKEYYDVLGKDTQNLFKNGFESHR